MTNQHPITPPYDQVYKWWEKECNLPPSFFYEKLYYVAKKAARWGADVELEACCEWVRATHFIDLDGHEALRAARRPQPKSLAEEALLAIDTAVADDRLSPAVAHAVRRALERLQELEGQDNDSIPHRLNKESDY